MSRLSSALALVLPLAALAAFATVLAAPDARPAAQSPQEKKVTGEPDPQVKGRPGEVVVDLFHPANQKGDGDTVPPMPEPRRGGRVSVHLASLPKHINYMTETSAVARWIQHEVHAYLVWRNWTTWEAEPQLARTMVVEDTLILKQSSAWSRDNIVFGEVREEGDEYVVTPKSKGNPLTEERRVPKAEVASLEKQTVFTFVLRPGVKWHDGHELDAKDVWFSWRCYFNPTVDCESPRPQITKIVDAEVLDDLSIRFFYAEQYFLALENFDGLTILPAHLYDLRDPANPKHDPTADPMGEPQGTFVNEHPNNNLWVGLGPYRVTAFNDQYVEAERFVDYYDPQDAGYVDTIRWRHIPSDDAAKQALLNGELDYFERLRAEEYFGSFTQGEAFLENYYKGYFYRPQMQYWAWNMRRPPLDERDVRYALGHAMDWDEFLRTQANGLGVRITATWPYLSPNYDHTLEPIPFDLEKAGELLDDAGWYDRDGDGWRDKRGQPLVIEYLMTTGNKASETMALMYQENLKSIGVQLSIATRDWSAFMERCKSKDFDTFGMAWILDPENTPRQLWHSWVGDPDKDRSSNYPGVKDEEIDRLIEEIEREIDRDARAKLCHRLQRRIYELQPYMFSYNTPMKFAMSKRIRNLRQYGLNPGYRIRDWYVVED